MSATSITGEYVCTQCNRRWTRMSDLKRHMVTHTGERKFKCIWPGCKSAFGQKSALKPHMNSHYKSRPYKCGIDGCDEHFSDPSSCTRHKKERHRSADVIYRCNAPGGGCASEIRRRSAFKTHLKKHGIDASNAYLDSCMARVRPCERKRRRGAAIMKASTAPDKTTTYTEEELYAIPQPFYYPEPFPAAPTLLNFYANSPLSADSPLYVPTPTSTPPITDFYRQYSTSASNEQYYSEEQYYSPATENEQFYSPVTENEQYYSPAPAKDEQYYSPATENEQYYSPAPGSYSPVLAPPYAPYPGDTTWMNPGGLFSL